ncbi:CpsD/CapB family tyrosine-protein kinase [Bacillus sp. FJAT-49736]|uniref:CpsD/CapB family tyrosine-protein kinase n=1 Tax=Bacillus sp. FJAT-49736 TaxID=2833582 RepID=UPI001BC91BCD|nr:CpsD/CapB family tyrosine-protein kinase [Bacillus sp. FJAT-49736]MBS4172938.1 CpsD/CapB family tyrosine-protein kinase [Bacillus sp. FJAT-49736]
MPQKQRNLDKKEISLVAYYKPQSYITEQYRLLKNNIQFSSVDEEIKSIVITSPEPGDGKTTTSANLAIVLAQQGKKVILVDADLRKPSIHYCFNSSNLHGLTNVLTKEISLQSAILKTHIHHLEILTSGPIPPNPSELLESKAMEMILFQLQESYDFVVIDTPPILAVSDSQILANKCDGVILVVSSGKTRKDAAWKSKNILLRANSRLIGVVMNGMVQERGEDYYQYGPSSK